MSESCSSEQERCGGHAAVVHAATEKNGKNSGGGRVQRCNGSARAVKKRTSRSNQEREVHLARLSEVRFDLLQTLALRLRYVYVEPAAGERGDARDDVEGASDAHLAREDWEGQHHVHM